MKQQDLIPKAKRSFRMKQPRKADIRWRAEIAEARLAFVTTPLWWRIWHRIASRLRREPAQENSNA